MRNIKFGVVGVKGIGRMHIKAILDAEDAELAAVADINEKTGRSAASQHDVEWYKNYEDMLELDDIDAVTICTPHFLHHPMAVKALERGKHVLVEKPMALTVREADEMVEQARANGLKLGVVFQFRTSPVSREIKAIIDSGELGRIYRVCMQACQFRTQLYYERDSWRGKWATEGGGALINQTIHEIDLLQWFVGKPARLQGQIGTLYHNVEVEDIACATIRFENGAFGVLQLGTVDIMGTSRLEICGEKGKIEKNGEAKRAVLDKPLQDYINEKQVWGVKPKYEWADIKPQSAEKSGHVAVVEDFARAILDDRKPLVSGEEGRTSLEIVNAIILSSFSGKTVDFPVDRDAYDKLMRRLSAKT